MKAPIPVTTSNAKLAGIVALSLSLSLFFFAPSLWQFSTPAPGSIVWARAITVLQQCEHPFRRDIEAAMQWRLLPPLVAHMLHLPGRTPLVLPWLGALIATAYVAVLFRRRCDDSRAILGGTLAFVSTSAVLVPFGLLGLNDAWVWFGLLVVAFSRSFWSGPLACLLCPWVDERFLIGYPLVWLIARIDRREPLLSRAVLGSFWLLPYLLLRLTLPLLDPTAGATQSGFLAYVFQSFPVVAPFVHIGWWFGLRGAWAGVAFACYTCPAPYRFLGALTLALTLAATSILAHDLSRSVAIIVPVAILGAFEFIRRHPRPSPRVLLVTGIVCLVLPAAHVIYTGIQPIRPLPIELFTLLRSHPAAS